MKFDFNEIIDRSEKSGSYSAKWQSYQNVFPGFEIDMPNTISMWVADMDFSAMPAIKNAIATRAEHGIFGYASGDITGDYFKAAVSWFKRRYSWDASTEHMLFSPGIVPAVNTAIQEFTEIGDGVIIQPPVYYPFAGCINSNERVVVNNPLLFSEGKYDVDFDSFEKLASDPKNKLFILCSPHNPVGRVWTRSDLERMSEICKKHDVLIFSDEIHADLILPNESFTTFGHLVEKNDRVILGHSASKTFNVAGLYTSVLTIPNDEIRQRMKTRAKRNCLGEPNNFGCIAGAVAYNHGDDFVDELLTYIDGNFKCLAKYVENSMNGVEMIRPEATYLAWLDFRATGLEPKEIYRRNLEVAKVAGDLGFWFGSEGEGFIRLNLACPRSTVERAAKRLVDAFSDIK